MMRRTLLFALPLLALAAGQSSEFRFDYEAYLYLVQNVDEVVFDFTTETPEGPGYLSTLDPTAYPTYAIPAASQSGWFSCLGVNEAPQGGYQGTTTSETGEAPVCRFAPSQIVRNENFQVNYLRTGHTTCEGPLYADGTLLVLSNTTWKVQARLTETSPEGIRLHILPLTYQDSETLCAKRRLSDARVASKDRTLTTGRTTLSTDPSARTSRAFYTQYQGIFAVPMLYYIEVDLGQLDPGLIEQNLTIEVEYLVRPR